MGRSKQVDGRPWLFCECGRFDQQLPAKAGKAIIGTTMSTTITSVPSGQKLTAEQLRRMPPAERDAILVAAATRAESEYCANPDLTGFEAFGKEDLHGDSANAQSR